MGSLDVGSVLADTYEVTRLIGRGGMGEVWLASHRRLPGKQVAIKVLHLGTKPLSPEALTRFRREAEVATRINHPNIVEVHDFNTLPDGAPYVVLEFLQGESLASRLRHPISLEEVQATLRQVGSALQAAHAQGVVHRDLKPDNIFIIPGPMGPVVKVLDFGISKLVDSTTLQTQDAVLVGTPAYMSPEQALGQNKDVGPQSDVFALGAIAYEMLSGAPPFAADSVAQLVFRIAYEPHRPLAQHRPELPGQVVQAVERALTKDRAQRHPDVASFILELTGSPLPPLLRRQDHPTQPSGVAQPGVGSSNSVMLGATVAPTPAPSSPGSLPERATPAPPRASPPVSVQLAWGRRVALVASLAAVVIGGVLFSQLSTDRPRLDSLAGNEFEEAARSPELEPKANLQQPAPEPKVAAVVDAPPPVTVAPGSIAPVSPPPARRAALPPPEELEQLKELLTLLESGKLDLAVGAADRANRYPLSPVGHSYAAMLGTKVHCARKDQAAAQSRFRNITEPGHSQEAKSYCKKFIGTELLSP